MTNDDSGSLVYYKLTLSAFDSGELKIRIVKQIMNYCCDFKSYCNVTDTGCLHGQFKWIIMHKYLLTVGIIGALRVLFLRPSKLKPSNHLCFWISRIPPLPKPSRSVGISLEYIIDY